MGRAGLVSDDVFFFSEKSRVQIRVWAVERDSTFPEGFKYSFVFLFENKRVLAYDNSEGKGHHCHKKGEPETRNPHLAEIRNLADLEKLRRTFMEEVRRLRLELGDVKPKKGRKEHEN